MLPGITYTGDPNPKGLVTYYGEGGGGYKTEWGLIKFYPYENVGAATFLAMLKGGGTKCFGVVFTQ